MNSPSRPDDPRKAEIIKHLRLLAKRHSRRLVVQDYLEYRAKHAGDLPSVTTLYRLFGSWPAAVVTAGVDRSDKTELSRTSDETLDNALRFVAAQLNTDTLSSHVYDKYRAQHRESGLPSSSVIRKWRGRWADAVRNAGLKSTERAVPRKPALTEIIEALRRAKGEIDGMLTPHTYTSLVADYPEEDRGQWPSTQHILVQFPNWESALRAADVEQSDQVHPDALWSAEEARRIWQLCTRLNGGKEPTEKTYNKILGLSKRPMPDWDVLRDLLSDA
jgi:hypothetical protein